MAGILKTMLIYSKDFVDKHKKYEFPSQDILPNIAMFVLCGASNNVFGDLMVTKIKYKYM